MRWLLMLILVSGEVLAAPVSVSGRDDPGPPSPTIAFGSPVRVLGGQFWYGMDMAVDSGGHVHLAASGVHAGKAGLWYVTDRTGTWVAKRILRWAEGRVYVHPSLALDVNDRVHIAVSRWGCVECTIAPAEGIFYLTDVGRRRGTFPFTPVRLTVAGTDQPSLRVAGRRLFLAFAGNVDQPLAAVRMKTNASGAWTTATVAPAGTKPSLRIGMDGRPRLAFEVVGGLRYATASRLTGGFTVRVITGTMKSDDAPLLSIDEAGGAHVIWLDTSIGAVRYSRLVSGAWAEPAWVDAAVQYGLSVDKPGKPWVVTGGAAVLAFRPVAGVFTGISLAADDSFDVTIKVLDSGEVVAAWFGTDPLGLWVSRT